MRTRRGSLLWSGSYGDAILMYKPGDVVKPITVTDQFFTGVVRAVDTKTNKITVAWGGGPESQHDADEIMPMPFFGPSQKDGAGPKVASRRMNADVDDLLDVPQIGEEVVESDQESNEQTDFLSNDMESLLNRQVGSEFYSAYLYYMVAAIFQSKGLVGFQAWFERQGDGEIEHAMKVYKYLVDTGSTVVLPSIPGPVLDPNMEVAELTRFVLDHEMGVTQDWKRIGQLAKQQDNPATCKLVQEFMDEQIEEEDASLTLHQKVQLADSGSGILLVDNDLKDRSPITASLNQNDVLRESDKIADAVVNQIVSVVSEYIDDTVGSIVDNKEAYELMCRTAFNRFMNRLKWRAPRLISATSGDEPPAQRTIWEEIAKKSSVSRRGSRASLMELKEALRDLMDAEGGEPDDSDRKSVSDWAAASKALNSNSEETVKNALREFMSAIGGEAGDSASQKSAWTKSKKFVGVSERDKRNMAKVATDTLRSRRAMYWCAPDRTYRLTQQEQDSGMATCPKCRIEMQKERFTRSEKLLNCPECGFKIPTSKAVSKVEIKVPAGTEVDVMTEDSSIPGQSITAGSGRSRQAYADTTDLADLPRMTLSQISMLVYKDWKSVNYGAKPYLQAMSTLQNVSDMYMQDTGTSIVAYFLANANSWRGDVARAVKKELQRRIR